MLYFDLDNNKIYINSYSPSLDDFNYYDNASKTHLPQEGGDNQTGHPYKFVYAPE